jgi:hypothetical protein
MNKEVGELKPIINYSVNDNVAKLKEQIKAQCNSDNVKFIGLSYHFLVDDNFVADVNMWAANFNPDDYVE